MGLGKTVRIDLDEVLVRAEDVYQMRQRTLIDLVTCEGYLED